MARRKRTRIGRGLNKLANKKIKSKPRSGKLIDTGSTVGAKIARAAYVKTLNFGFKKGKGRKR